jgi:hypothetical protein
MLKRKGQMAESVVPGSTVRLTPGQLNAYTAAFVSYRVRSRIRNQCALKDPL